MLQIQNSKLSEYYAEGYCLFDSFRKHNCIAAFSCGRLDLGFSNEHNFQGKRKVFLKKLRINFPDLICLQQVHGNRILLAAEKEKGRGALEYNSAIPGYDGLVTRESFLPLAVFTADCLSIFILDTKQRLAGILHAGWRGTKDNILLAALRILKQEFSGRAEDIICGFGPGIRSCCYEVGPEFADYFSHRLIRRRGKFFLDLVEANFRQLLDAGILKKNITDSSICTSCQNKDFFSYRKEGPAAGRMMSVIMMK